MNFTWAEFPEGVLCEGCDNPFQDGQEIALWPHAVAGGGIPILMGLCPRCVSARLKTAE